MVQTFGTGTLPDRTLERIVAEVFIGILTGDSQSYLQVDPGWTPAREGLVPEGNLAELVKFAISGK